MKEINDLRNICQLEIEQMRHCQQCRADAIGLLGEDRSQEFRMANRPSLETPKVEEKKYKIAVTSKYGKLVDQHFGHASTFSIYQGDGTTFERLDDRLVENFCTGVEECDSDTGKRDHLIDTLQDCDAVLTMRIGHHAKEKLREKDIYSVVYCDTVENGLRHVVGELSKLHVKEG